MGATVARGARWLTSQVHELSGGASQAAAGSERTRHIGGWVCEHVPGLRILGVVVAALFVVLGGDLTGGGLLIIVIVLVAYLGLVQLIVVWARRVAGPPAIAASHEGGAGPTHDEHERVSCGRNSMGELREGFRANETLK